MAIFLSGRNARLALTSTSSSSFRNHLAQGGKLSQRFDRNEDVYVAMDLDRQTLKEMSSLGVNPDGAVLLRFEPAVVCPLNFSRLAGRRFSKTIDIGRQLHKGNDWEYWPQNWPDEFTSQKAPDFQTRIETTSVLMNANKLSLVENEQYSLRRQVIHSLPIDTFGPNWDSTLLTRFRTLAGELLIALKAGYAPRPSSLRLWFSQHPNLRGVAEDKLETLSQYRYAVVIENSPEYMSEKLFDAIFAGCIPVYSGPNVEEFGIPASLVVQTKPDIASIASAFNEALQIDEKAWESERISFLTEATTEDRWASRNVFERLAVKIEACA